MALKDPTSLRDQSTIDALLDKLGQTEDPVKRLAIRQQLREAKSPSIEKREDAFVEHAKAWADEKSIGVEAFLEEGVPAHVLRRAGFRSVPVGRRTPRGSRSATGRSRVSADEVRGAIPKGTFTLRQLQDASGASYGVVRRIVEEEVQAGRVKAVGPDPDHFGRGRTPILYRR
jgi:hypothetical protein